VRAYLVSVCTANIMPGNASLNLQNANCQNASTVAGTVAVGGGTSRHKPARSSRKRKTAAAESQSNETENVNQSEMDQQMSDAAIGQVNETQTKPQPLTLPVASNSDRKDSSSGLSILGARSTSEIESYDVPCVHFEMAAEGKPKITVAITVPTSTQSKQCLPCQSCASRSDICQHIKLCSACLQEEPPHGGDSGRVQWVMCSAEYMRQPCSRWFHAACISGKFAPASFKCPFCIACANDDCARSGKCGDDTTLKCNTCGFYYHNKKCIGGDARSCQHCCRLAQYFQKTARRHHEKK
jgi:hypothetical protein